MRGRAYETAKNQTEAIDASSKLWKSRINKAALVTAVAGLGTLTFSKWAAVLGVASQMEGSRGEKNVEAMLGGIDLASLNAEALLDVALKTAGGGALMLVTALGLYFGGNRIRKVLTRRAKRDASRTIGAW